MTHFIEALPLPEAIKKILYQKQGPLTRELLRKPGEFGLGQVPAAKKPDATTTAVCGYCGTGCGLNLHLQQGNAISLTPKTRNSAVLRKLYPEKAFTEINPADAKSLGISQNDLVTVSSQRGSIRCQAFLTHAVQRGQLFIPMHYEDVNQLTDAVFDPYSKQPSYKACAVTVTRSHHAGA